MLVDTEVLPNSFQVPKANPSILISICEEKDRRDEDGGVSSTVNITVSGVHETSKATVASRDLTVGFIAV